MSRTFTRPFHGEYSGRADEEAWRKMMFGFTTIELRCSECGDLKHIQVTGRAEAADG